MAGATLTTADLLLQNKYIPGLADYVNRRRALWSRIRRAGEDVQFAGRSVIWAGKFQDNQGVNKINEGEVMPTSGTIDVVNLSSSLKYYYGNAVMTAQSMKLANRDGAFSPLMKETLDSTRDTLIDEMAFDTVYGTGYGDRGKVSTYSTPTLTMVATTVKGGIGNRALRRDMYLSSYSALSGGVQGADYKRVTLVPAGGATATTEAGAGFNASDYVFRARAAGVDPRNKALMGLGGIVDDGTLVGTIYGASRTTYPELKAIVQGNSGTLRAITPELVTGLLSSIMQDGGGNPPSLLYSRREIVDRMAAYLATDRRGSLTEMTLPGGYKAVEWNDPEAGTLAWASDRYSRPHCVNAVRESDLFWAIDEDIQFEERGGGMWHLDPNRTHSFEAILYTWRQLCSKAFNSHGKLDDIDMFL